MRYLKLIALFFQSSAQEELAHRANFWIHILHALLNLATGAAGMWILFQQVQRPAGLGFHRRAGYPGGISGAGRPAQPGVWPQL